MAINFPSSPTDGQEYNGYIYVSTKSRWEVKPSVIEMPVASIVQTAASSSPSGWLLCEGQAVSRTTYASLFTTIGTVYGAGDGSTTFNIPDLRTRIPVGKNGSGTFATLGAKGGAETHTLAAGEIPSHTHSFSATTSTNGNHGHNILSEYGASGEAYFNPYNNRQIQPAQPGAGTRIERGSMIVGSGDHNHSVSGTTGSSGSGTAHNNLQPYIVLNYIIKI